MKYQGIIDKMKLEDKVALCSGAGFWSTKRYDEYGIPSIWMNDGPHGLRKQADEEDHLGISKSRPSTCFPAACATSSSWDRDLIYEMGIALGNECLQEQTNILLGPGINIKRNPLCGRNFEYFSEDPFLAGELATQWILAVQSKGVAVSLKHFAANSQENQRLTSDSVVDERALREIYLSAFEIAVKNAKPKTIMCAYNLLNGTYCSDNKYLLTDILRQEWGFDGVVISDWGATNDRVEGFKAGMDLEMPGSNGHFDKSVIEAVRSGRLSESDIDISVDRLLTLIFDTVNIEKGQYDLEAHHQLARKVARESAVLLKNDDSILPIKNNVKLALIGDLANDIRYQGSGSSRINPTKLSNFVDGFKEYNADFRFYKGYENSKANMELMIEAANAAKQADIAIVVAGLPDDFESEGFDRTLLDMPESHNALINEVAAQNKNTIVVLLGGAPVTMPWLSKVKAVVNMYLPGQAGGLAAADIIFGTANPSGKLAETYPACYSDVVCSDTYGVNPKQALYSESIFVGYRYYDKANKNVLFPFGFGLSYTSFSYSDFKVIGEFPNIKVCVTVKNTGNYDGAEVVQLYVGKPQDGVFCPQKELKGFEKVWLKKGERATVDISLDDRAFSYYNVQNKEWIVQSGTYSIMLGSSSRDIYYTHQISSDISTHQDDSIMQIDSTTMESIARQKVFSCQEGIASQDCISSQADSYAQNSSAATVTAIEQDTPSWYYSLDGRPTRQDFSKLLSRTIEPYKEKVKGQFDMSSSIAEMRDSGLAMRLFYKIIELYLGKHNGGVDYSNPNFKMMMESTVTVPLKSMILLSGGLINAKRAKAILNIGNGHFFKGIAQLMRIIN